MLTAKRQLFLSVAVVGLLLLPPLASAGHMTLVLRDVTGGEAEGRGGLGHGWLRLKITGLPPLAEFVVELLEAVDGPSRPLGRFVTTQSGRARLTVEVKDTTISPETLIRVRRVVEETLGEVVLEGRVP